jgi:hypothetical protein
MMRRSLLFWLLGIAVLAPSARGGDGLKCTATIVHSDEPRIGGWPAIRLEIVNTSAAAIQILDVWQHPSLWCPYSDLLLTRSGKAIGTRLRICDNFGVEAESYGEIGPGEKKSLEVIPYDQSGLSLPAGRYSLCVSWQYDPLHGNSRLVSTPVTFEVFR